MDDQWLNTLLLDVAPHDNAVDDVAPHQIALIVPTRSLVNELSERIARARIKQGQSVWAAPNILVWADYLRLIWQHNREALLKQLGVYTLISASQSALLWTQVIETSRRQESELALLNVQQTVRAVQRSWKLMHDWRINASQLKQDHVADTEQFARWCDAYQSLLRKRGLLDESGLLAKLSNPDLQHPFKELVWVSYDLLTAAQSDYLEQAQQCGVNIRYAQPNVNALEEHYYHYPDTVSEISSALEHARHCLEQDPAQRISVVIPDLQHRQTQVQEIAREVFYPAASPLSVQHSDVAYRFSLGQSLSDIAAIEAALSVLSLLKNKVTTIDLGFLLRNRFLGLSEQHRDESRLFEQWLMRQRIHSFAFDQVPELYQQCLEYYSKREEHPYTLENSALLEALQALVTQRQHVQAKLSDAKQLSDYAALRFVDWVVVFSDWLDAWQWRTYTGHGAQMNSVQFQLLTRWNTLLEEFASFTTVQRRAGLNRALELLQQMTRNTVFLAKGADSPVVISGLLEAIGREVDTLIVTGMHQDYPSPNNGDAFIANRFLQQAGHPEASAESGFMHAQKVMQNLLACASRRIISYALMNDNNREIAMQASPLFRNKEFIAQDITHPPHRSEPSLESYQDTQGPAWLEPGRAKGGSRIFENQSNCAFKAFATHQLGFISEDEAEFGLDGLDRGNVVHHLLDLLWGELQTQSQLLSLDQDARLQLINTLIDRSLADGSFKLNNEKLTLLAHEKRRLQTLLLAWLAEEEKRPNPFSVVEREEQGERELEGIRYRYVIDRLDVMEDGRSVIIDYKTGAVNRNDWTGERLKSPQMPLYALTLDSFKNQPVSGIAYGQLKQGDPKFIELAETDIFRKESSYAKKVADQWQSNRSDWPAIFAQLAKDFLAGEASVNPIDKKTCQYCDLHSLCRVSQLRQNSAQGSSE